MTCLVSLSAVAPLSRYGAASHPKNRERTTYNVAQRRPQLIAILQKLESFLSCRLSAMKAEHGSLVQRERAVDSDS